MPAWRTHGEDFTYGEAHRDVIRQIFGQRVGHRTHAADRDFTEACAICRQPLGITEHVICRGQDLRDKGTQITQKLAARADVPAWLVGMHIERSAAHERELAEIGRRAIQICREETRILGFSVRQLAPTYGAIQRVGVDDWFTLVGALHKDHWLRCHPHHKFNRDTRATAMYEHLANTPLALPRQQELWKPRELAS